MLIINADDYGMNRLSTDRALSCFDSLRITSASAMVFMADSERAATLGLEQNLDTGLHLNFSQEFTAKIISDKLRESHRRLRSFFSIGRYASLIYNPLISNDFEYVYRRQCDEYIRLYGGPPSHIDGHRHLHLCFNMLIGRYISPGTKIRRNFTFCQGEKNAVNRLGRQLYDSFLRRRYTITDYFFDISPISSERLCKMIAFARFASVELMVHPERPDEYNFLMSDDFGRSIRGIATISYDLLPLPL